MCAGLTEDHVGKVVPLKFLEVDQAKNRLVVSNRRAMVETKLTNLEPGQLVQVCFSSPPFSRTWLYLSHGSGHLWGVECGGVHACTCCRVSVGWCRGYCLSCAVVILSCAERVPLCRPASQPSKLP